MSQGVFQPVGQKRLTNIAVVRLKSHGKRFEIACYKNKVYDWRSGAETDLDEVVQTTDIFVNVNKGQFAKDEDLKMAFGTSDGATICREILKKGDLQVSEKERKVELDGVFRDIASIITEKCINPDTNRPYTMGLIQRGLRDIHFAADPKRSAKQQAFEAIPRLEERFPIKRAMMRVAVTLPAAARADFAAALTGEDERFEAEDLVGDAFKGTCLIQPGRFRALCTMVSELSDGAGRVEVMAVAAQDAAPRRAAGGTAERDGAAAEAVGWGQGPPVEEVVARLSLGADGAGAAPAGGPLRGGFSAIAAPAVVPVARARTAPGSTVVWQRGPIADIPDEWANRREMFKAIDELQAGWTVELRSRGEGGTVDALFFDSEGAEVGGFAAARRQALAASKA